MVARLLVALPLEQEFSTIAIRQSDLYIRTIRLISSDQRKYESKTIFPCCDLVSRLPAHGRLWSKSDFEPNSDTRTNHRSNDHATTIHPYPPVEGPEPTTQVGIFYYPWYSNPATDGEWINWSHTDFTPPLDIMSDFYPVLGPYSAQNPMTLARQFAWLREAGIGLIISSWWSPINIPITLFIFSSIRLNNTD